MTTILIGIFGLIGILSRYSIDRFCAPPSTHFPITTLSINLMGCFLAGLFSLLAPRMNGDLNTALLVGFCGGFTTFSAYALQSLSLFEKGAFSSGLLYFFLSPVLGLVFAFLPISFARYVFKM